MIIQIGHSRSYDYEKELYMPIINSELSKIHEIILPHDGNSVGIDSKQSLKNLDIFLAEVSYPATGLGIELGFASAYGKKIICFYQKGKQISGSLKYICDDFIEYTSSQDMIEKIGDRIVAYKNGKH